ncbi:hypothetical protein J6590_066649 [Homalodisca vitripennis]|nr:hypothetical protein J6590_066649 [Homalodisca vitripennis]
MEEIEVVEFEVKVNKWLNPEIRADNLLAINCAELCKAAVRRGGVPVTYYRHWTLCYWSHS